MSTKSLLLKVARTVLNMVLSEIAKNMGQLEDMVRNPLQSIVQEVVNGVWIGDGANKFVDEVTNMVVPGAEKITACCDVTRQSITRASDIMDAADQQVNSLVNNLDAEFKAIF